MSAGSQIRKQLLALVALLDLCWVVYKIVLVVFFFGLFSPDSQHILLAQEMDPPVGPTGIDDLPDEAPGLMLLKRELRALTQKEKLRIANAVPVLDA